MGSTMPEKPIGIQLRKILAAVKNRCVSFVLILFVRLLNELRAIYLSASAQLSPGSSLIQPT